MAIEANAGARVGDYVLVKKIGEGGMAEVWLTRHYSTAQLRALKFLNVQYQGIPEVEARFQSEGESTLVHPNIVRVYEVGQHAGSSYIAMEFIDGHDLESILNSRRGPLTVTESIDIGVQILAGLGFAHASGIIHRDIKPSNVLVSRDGHAYVMDFGIAKVLRAGRMLTQVNSRLGTPDYMSPEQIRNPRDVDARSDIYSFGCLFYELLTGWPPFDRGEGYETEHEIKTAHVTIPPKPPMLRKTSLPAQLNDITLKCLAKAKEDRPQSCDEILTALNVCRVLAQPVRNPRSSTVVEPSPSPGPSSSVDRGGSGGQGSPQSLPSQNARIANPPPIPQHLSDKPSQQQSDPRRLDVPFVRTGAPLRGVPVHPLPKLQENDKGGVAKMMLIAAASLFLLIAAGVSGWNWYQKHQNDSSTSQSGFETDRTQGSAANRSNPSHGPEPSTQGNATSRKSGTLIWTGTPTATGQTVTIVRSLNTALGGGEISGDMFPAGPVRISVRPPAEATIIPPDAGTNYDSMQLSLPNPGQQTIYIDWTALPN